MLRHIIFTLLLTLTTTTWSSENKDGENQNSNKWSQLMKLIDNEIHTIKSNKYSGPELKHRLFELYSEKIKLIKEKENLILIKTDPKKINSEGKDSFFKHSHEQYQTAEKFALSLISQYPKYDRINELYYALAINSRDYGTSDETEKYLKQAIQTSKNDSKTIYNAKTALAEFYYNNKKYHEAISYYTDVLKNTENEWYGKNLYNTSWCYLKERNFNKALELIKLSFETTKNKKYVSMREQIITAIGIFFVQGDATHEAIEFFEKNTTPSSPSLLLLARSSMNKNNFSITEDVLRAALKDTLKRKDVILEMKVRLSQLDIYRESKKEDLYFETANAVLDLSKKNKLDKDDLDLAVNKIKEVAGYKQVNLVKDKTSEVVQFNKNDFKKIIRYIDILSVLDKTNKNQYRYYQGETALSIHDYQQALQFYVRSVMNSKKTRDTGDVTRKSLEAMLTVIEPAKMKKNLENEYIIFAFKNFVIFYPQSTKSQVIYQKLFNKYYELHKTKKALNVLLVYKYNYPDDVAIHREMLTQILDTYIKEKNTDKLAFWINKIEAGYLQFSSDYIQNSTAVLGGLLFDKYQNLEKKGQIKEAMNGYESIYDSKKYPKRTKAEAAYAIAALYQIQNKSRDSNKWLHSSLDLYDDKDLLKITKSLLAMARSYRLLQDFALSSELAELISQKYCDQDFPEKNDFYELAISNSTISIPTSANIQKLENKLNKCKIEKRIITKNQNESFQNLLLVANNKEIQSYFESHSDNENIMKLMSFHLRNKYMHASKAQKEILKKSIVELDTKFPELKLQVLIIHSEIIDQFIEKIEALKFSFTNLPIFDEKKYNSELEQYFSIIADINKDAVKLSNDSTVEEVLRIRKVLSLPYFSLLDSVNRYTPQGVDSRYLEGFKSGMRQITESLAAKGLQCDQEKNTFLEKNNFFLEIQKHDKFENNLITSEGLLKNHSALIFTNTIDLSRN